MEEMQDQGTIKYEKVIGKKLTKLVKELGWLFELPEEKIDVGVRNDYMNKIQFYMNLADKYNIPTDQYINILQGN